MVQIQIGDLVSRWQIPIGWQWAKAPDIALIVGGGTPSTKKSSNFAEKGIPWLTPADLSGYQEEYVSRGKRDLSKEGYNESGAQLMPKDSVLFTSRAPIGYCVLAANEISTNQGFKSLVLKGGINPKYIRLYLLSSKQYAESLASGSTFKELSGHRMASLEIPIPPLNEQKRIVARIEELQARRRRAKEALESIPDLLEQLRQSILAAAFRGNLTKEWREKHHGVEPASKLLKRILAERRKCWEEAERDKIKAKGLSGDKLNEEFAKRRKQYKEPAPVNTSDLPELPQGWCWASIEELLRGEANLSYGILKPGHQDPTGVPMLRITDIGDGKISATGIMKVSARLASEYARTKLEEGDIVLAVMATIGRAAVVPKAYHGANVNRALAVLKITHHINPRFLLFFLLSPIGIQFFQSKQMGSAQMRINLNDLRQMPVPIPPAEEHLNIIEQIETVRDKSSISKSAYETALSNLRTFEQSILSRGFRGELVPQNPTDEPASILLERIRQVKAHEATQPKVKNKRKHKKMKHKLEEQRDVLAILRKSDQAMTPEEVFSAAGFDEAQVDIFYEQLREFIVSKKVREIRKGKTIRLEAITP